MSQVEGAEKLIEHVKTDFHEVQFKKHQDVTLDIPKPKPKPQRHDESAFPPPTSEEKERRVLEEANKIAGIGRRERPPSPPPGPAPSPFPLGPPPSPGP